MNKANITHTSFVHIELLASYTTTTSTIYTMAINLICTNVVQIPKSIPMEAYYLYSEEYHKKDASTLFH
jgi:hypothetical protein